MGESKYPHIRSLREDIDLSQKEMANIININRRTYSAYETGANEWPVDIVVEIAKLFNTTTDYLLSLTDEQESLKTR